MFASNAYLREVGPDNLDYDKYLKGYKPTSTFTPQVTQGIADEYLHLMARNNDLAGMFENLNLHSANIEVLSVPLRDVRPELLRPLVTAARRQKRLGVDYVSIHNPDRDGRIIVPHTIVHTGLRWHEQVTIRVVPEPRLTEAQQITVENFDALQTYLFH